MANDFNPLEPLSQAELDAEQELLRQQHNQPQFNVEFERAFNTLNSGEIEKLVNALKLVTLRKVKRQGENSPELIVLEYPSGEYTPGSEVYKAISLVRVYFEVLKVQKHVFNSARVKDTTGLLDTSTFKVR